MDDVALTYKQAGALDIDALLSLVHEYYACENLPLDDAVARRRLKEFIQNPQLGYIWLIMVGGNLEGYIAVTNGYGLEHGRNVILDEFYIRDSFRGRGIGKMTLRFIEEELRPRGVESIHTEVERGNTGALKFWENLGFHRQDRYPMVKMTRRS
ncbi:MAG: GNAT family N-acetyltransferase [Candidatus Zixiibacteriota bacterium]|nr:MAG: GNAT family N-acetyltransferase [candidate division Zixibacteria bacterium]